MKAVLISIQPKWCELIASGKKTVEVRKSAPKLETPFKCYIYMTKSGNPALEIHNKDGNSYAVEKNYRMAGKVIGEFVCERINKYPFDWATFTAYGTELFEIKESELNRTCLSRDEFNRYGADSNMYKGYLFGWHISELKIYDKPKGLGEFKKGCKDMDDPMYGSYCEYCENKCYLASPPQSWQYVEV